MKGGALLLLALSLYLCMRNKYHWKHTILYKYLGVTTDEILSFRAHLNNTIKEIVAHKKIVMNKIRNYITENAAVKICKAMILPYLDYGDIFFVNANSVQLKKL